MATDEKGEKVYNYLEALETDKWARERMEEPIEFDWNRISTVKRLEIDESWDSSRLALDSLKRKEGYMRVVVQCPNPKHNIFKMVMHENPTERELKCPCCITEEMDRILSLRFIRDMKARKSESSDL